MPRINKKRSHIRNQQQRPSSTQQPSVEIPNNLGELSIAELKDLCRDLNFSSTGGRRVLTRRRLQNEKDRLGGSATESAENPEIISPAVRHTPASFSDEQLEKITQIVSQSIASFFDSQQANTNATPLTRVDEAVRNPQPQTPLDRLEHLRQFPFLNSSELQRPSTSANATVASDQQADVGFTPEIPNKYVRDIESGEFFELAKLLPKNLNKSNVGSDYPDNVGFTISSAGISLTPRKPQVLTNIEEWTTAFNTYLLIVVQKFPNRATELLQYMETICYAAKTHGGLGWCIYNHKFRHKAASCRTLSWANIDTQLWLRIFTASATQLHEDYSLFSNGPSNRAGATRDGVCHSYNRGRPCPFRPNCPYVHQCNRFGCGRKHPGYQCPQAREEPARNEDQPSRSDRSSKKATRK